MKERPILFSGEMVRALLREADPKSQTRRILKVEHSDKFSSFYPDDRLVKIRGGSVVGMDDSGLVWRPYAGSGIVQATPKELSAWCPHGGVGERLWVREAYWLWGKWVPNDLTETGRNKWKFVAVGTGIRYQENPPSKTAKRDGECGWVYRHARYMLKDHSRITLEVTDVRVPRLQEISEEDAIAEGLERRESTAAPWAPFVYRDYSLVPDDSFEWFASPRKSFESLWQSINGKNHPWLQNEYVWAISFKKI